MTNHELALSDLAARLAGITNSFGKRTVTYTNALRRDTVSAQPAPQGGYGATHNEA